ncbi:MAG: UbiA family prenyltransferase [Nitrososphaeria archaeon]
MQRTNLRAYCSIIRPVNSVMVGIAVIIGIILTAPQAVLSWKAAFGFLTGFFISSFSMIVNDIYDVEVDRINQLKRPLVTGSLNISQAWIYSMVMLALGIAFSLLTSFSGFVIAALFGFISWLYNYNLKRYGIIGNLTVAFSTSIPYVYGNIVTSAVAPNVQTGILQGTSTLVLWFTIVSFLAVTGREVIKTMLDTEGDRIRGINSVSRVLGDQKTAMIGAAFFISAVACTFIPYILRQTGNVYLVMILIPDILFFYLSYSILEDYSNKNILRAKRLALVGMLLGFMAFVTEKVVI